MLPNAMHILTLSVSECWIKFLATQYYLLRTMASRFSDMDNMIPRIILHFLTVLYILVSTIRWLHV